MSKKQMPAFDQLPRDVRAMLRELDFNFKADDVLYLHEQGWSCSQIRRKLEDIALTKHRTEAAQGHVALQK